MGYLPGPLALQNAADVGIVVSDYDFRDDALNQLGGIDATLAGWDDFLSDAAVLLDEPSDPIAGIDLNGAIDTMNVYAEPATAIGVNALTDALGVADVQLSQAIGFAPPEAWVDSSAQFIPPAAAETLAAPYVNPGAISTQVEGIVSGTFGTGGTPSPVIGSSATLTNLTAYGNASFTVGDQWQVSLTGGPGNQVYVDSTLNGVELPGAVEGTIGADHTLVLTGQMTKAAVGVWSQTWWVGSNQVATFNFIVVDA